MRFKDLGIGTKTAVVSGVAILTMQIISSLTLSYMEDDLISSLISDNKSQIEKMVEEQEVDQTKSLDETIKTLAAIAHGTAGPALESFDFDVLKPSFLPYTKLQELRAITVNSPEGDPFFAIWKDSTGTKSISEKDVPQIVKDELVKLQAHTINVVHNKEKLGVLSIYYTDSVLKDKIAALKEEGDEASLKFKASADEMLNFALILSVVVAVVVSALLIAIIMLTLKVAAMTPLKKSISYILEVVKTGRLSKTELPDSKDEIHTLTSAINDMIDSLNDKASLATSIASGDLTNEITLASPEDTLGNALLDMTKNLNKVIGGINQTAVDVSTQSKQVS